MDRSRWPGRQLRLHSNQLLDNAADRLSSHDSGRESTSLSGRSSAGAAATTSTTTSPISRSTPSTNHLDAVPVRIRRTPVIAGKCYEQAFVSHVDHPSAFFIQLAPFQDEYKQLLDEINEFYSANPRPNSSEWKRGDYCIARFTDDVFYRARIVEVPAVTKAVGFFDVVYVDYGNWGKVAAADVHLLLPKFAAFPAQALPCSLTKSLPENAHTWFDHPPAIELFKELVFEKYVDATIARKTNRDCWPMTLVDLCLSDSKANVRECMKAKQLLREVSNEQIFHEFASEMTRQDYIIYSIRHEGDENDIDDDDMY